MTTTVIGRSCPALVLIFLLHVLLHSVEPAVWRRLFLCINGRDPHMAGHIRGPVASLRLNPHGAGFPATSLAVFGPTFRRRETERADDLVIWTQFSRLGSSI